jgi:hypothetical protein
VKRHVRADDIGDHRVQVAHRGVPNQPLSKMRTIDPAPPVTEYRATPAHYERGPRSGLSLV